jgi:hypothetical protein
MAELLCVDLSPEEVARGRVMADVLGLPQVRLQCRNVHDMGGAPADLALEAPGCIVAPAAGGAAASPGLGFRAGT